MTGLVIGTLSPNPMVAFAGGLISHLITDAIPHLDARSFRAKSTRKEIWPSDVVIGVIDGAIATALFVYMARHGATPTVLMGAIGGVFPDIMEAPFFLFYRERYRWFHHLALLHELFHFDKTKFRKNQGWIYAGAISQIVLLFAGYVYLRSTDDFIPVDQPLPSVQAAQSQEQPGQTSSPDSARQ